MPAVVRGPPRRSGAKNLPTRAADRFNLPITHLVSHYDLHEAATA
jgi:hypothetical protein